MYKAYCLLGAFIGFLLFVIMCNKIRKTTKELEENQAEIKRLEERINNPNGTRKNV